VRICERAGIQEYLIIKPYGADGERDFSLTGYHLIGGQYQPWEADGDGYLTSKTLQVRFRVRADRRDIELVDAVTGETLRGMGQP
jgi:Uma2 family endonuclease